MYRENVLTQGSDKEVEELYMRFRGRISKDEARQKVFEQKLKQLAEVGRLSKIQIRSNHLAKEEVEERLDTYSNLYNNRSNPQVFAQVIYDELFRIEYKEGITEGSYHQLLTLCIQLDYLNSQPLSEDMEITLRMVKGFVFGAHVRK